MTVLSNNQRRAKGFEPTWNIMINDVQRLALIDLIRAAGVDQSGSKGDEHALEYWLGMLTELPLSDDEPSDMVHGWALALSVTTDV